MTAARSVQQRLVVEWSVESSAAEFFHRAFFEHSADAGLLATRDGRILAANPAACKLLRMTEAELCAAGRAALVDSDAPELRLHLEARQEDGQARSEMMVRRGDGTAFPAEVHSQEFIAADGTALAVVIARDVTEQRRTEAKLTTLGQYYAALSMCNEAIVRSTCEADLFAAVCQAAVQVQGIDLAWVGMVDAEGRVRPVAAAGAGQAYLEGIHITAIPGDPSSEGPTGSAIRERQPYWCHDFARDPRTAMWQKRGERFGWSSSAALPLRRGGEPVGALTLYMRSPDLLGEEVRVLLCDMASDISFALDGFAREAERRRTEQALASNAALLRQLLESSIDGIMITDPDAPVEDSGGILLVNPAACALLGRSEEDILRVGRAGILDASDANLVALLKKRAQHGHVRGELDFIHADGHRIPTEVSSAVFEGMDGKRLASVLIRDIRDRLRRDAEIRKLSLAVEQSPESILITDLACRIEYVNDATCRVSGYGRDELIGATPALLRSGLTPPETYTSMWDALGRGEAWKGQFINRRKNGEIYTEFAFVSPIRTTDGKVTHYLGLKDDITEKKRMGEELDSYRRHLEELVKQRTAELAEARARAEDANRAKSAFLANMSHEIRTPMNAILGLTYLMRQQQPTPEQSTRLDKVAVSARHLLTLIDSILDLSKIEAGRMAVESVDFELAAVVRDVCDILRARADEKGLVVTRSVDEGVPAMLRGDPLRLRQILINLGGNAVKFTQQGAVALKVRPLPATADGMLRLRFEVSDTGIGIDAEQRASLFQPFEQADASMSRRFGGTGLGLAISRRLVELMGGHLDMQSTPGQGSSFWFEVPFAKCLIPQASAQSPSVQIPATALPLHILVAEDDEINQEVAKELLESAGHKVDLASDGAAAVELAQMTRYDLVLMDLQMPVVDGLQATRQLRALPGYAATPILAMTANAFEEDRRQCLDAGMNDFIGKPVDPDRMFAAVRRWTRKLRGLATPTGPFACALPQPEVHPDHSQGLRAVRGLDCDAGLHVVQGQWPAYERLLHRFVSDHSDDLLRIRRQVESRKFADAQRTAHTLKGIAGTIGALPLREAAAKLEVALRAADQEPPNLEEQFASVDLALAELAADLRTALPPAEPEATPPQAVDWALAGYLVRTLEAYLVADDVWAGTLFAENSVLLRAALGSAAQGIEQQIQQFDFSGALGLLRAATEQVPQLTAGDGHST